ncbi:ATPase, T2SS/T4P/T4SS family [Methylocaldum sp.]|uniref:ATPase, T2SS/T4P/T4SS family n=1 Tax=Methylocaldum sp. TaxID=1969727 RepID=UPI002D5F818F|nr:ATPase, T2SS/T4P/T4SS family [Methylocaldum sp.]HYE36085.1 ATPase, T2SS/T4P/T4SS family [Methylocaldum sp.]
MNNTPISFKALPDDTEQTAEKRLDRREGVPSQWVATVYGPEDMEVSGTVVNVSPGGVGLWLPANAPADLLSGGAGLIVTIHSPAKEFTRPAEICWLLPGSDGVLLGVKFYDCVAFTPQSHRLDIASARIDPACAMRIPANVAFRRQLLPFVEMNGAVHVACADPQDTGALAVAERMVKAPVVAWGADPDELKLALTRVYGDSREVKNALPVAVVGDNRSASELTDDLLNAAFLRQASDIHIDPERTGVTIRFRIDGKLETYARLPNAVYQEIVSRFKVMSGLDIAEKRAPQDGRFTHQFATGGKRIDLRVATLPTKYGERMTLRLLALDTESLTLDRLGFNSEHRHTIETFLRRSQGMMILTGPTGSGKTTTLYAAIRLLLSERNVNILTVEDPIEYAIDGVSQCEVDAADKVSFAKALRSMLRHDPDVMMIGEIRDRETADVAIKAALTGHLVLGTLHTNSAAATVTRLLDMGVEPYLVAATLRLIVAQRLVRRLCPHCRIPRPLTEREAFALGRPDLTRLVVYEPGGCVYCIGKGYAGRLGLYEMLPLKSEWARGIVEGETEPQLIERMRAERFRFLLDDGLEKLVAGQTSVSEVMQIALSW